MAEAFRVPALPRLLPDEREETVARRKPRKQKPVRMAMVQPRVQVPPLTPVQLPPAQKVKYMRAMTPSGKMVTIVVPEGKSQESIMEALHFTPEQQERFMKYEEIAEKGVEKVGRGIELVGKKLAEALKKKKQRAKEQMKEVIVAK